MKRFAFGLISLLLAACSSTAFAADTDILVGASLPLSGPNAGAGKEGLAVAQAYLDSVNKGGGIGGRRISLVVLDDAFDARRAASNARTLVDQGVVAIFNCWGTSSCSAMMPVTAAAGVPLVSGIAGGGPMQQSPDRYTFNVRPSTDQEISRMVRQMASVGQTEIAVVYQDDGFGKSGLAASRGAFASSGLKPVAELALAPDGSDAASLVQALAKLPKVSGVILLAAPPPTVKMIVQARKSGLAVQFYNLAAQANRKVVAELGSLTDGVVFSTVVPSPWKDSNPVIKEYQQLFGAEATKLDYSYLGMEVFINARVLVEGLRKAGPRVTRESLVAGLESMGEKRFGNVAVSYAGGKRSGSPYTSLAIISRDGRFVE